MTIPKPEIRIHYICPACRGWYNSEQEYEDHFTQKHIMAVSDKYGKFCTEKCQLSNGYPLSKMWYVVGPSKISEKVHIIEICNPLYYTNVLYEDNCTPDADCLDCVLSTSEAIGYLKQWTEEYCRESTENMSKAIKIMNKIIDKSKEGRL